MLMIVSKCLHASVIVVLGAVMMQKKRQNNVGVVRLMNEAMKKAAFAALGFFIFGFSLRC